MTSNSGTVNRLYEKVETFAPVEGRGKIQVAIGRPHTLDFSPKALLSHHPNCISNRWPLLTHDVKGCLRKNAQDWAFQEQLSSPSASHWASGALRKAPHRAGGNAVPRGRIHPVAQTLGPPAGRFELYTMTKAEHSDSA